MQDKPKLAADVCHRELAALTANFTGADLSGLVRQASLQALKESIASSLAMPTIAGGGSSDDAAMSDDALPISVQRKHFVSALKHIRPSVSEEVSGEAQQCR